jgi:translation initiation factor IF-3
MLVSAETDPPVCKVLDYGQYKYHQQKKDRKAKKTQKGHIIKELKLSPKIADGDFQTKVNHGKAFLEKGYKVKVRLDFRGRQIVHPELGRQQIERYVSEIEALGAPESDIQRMNRSIWVILVPK